MNKYFKFNNKTHSIFKLNDFFRCQIYNESLKIILMNEDKKLDEYYLYYKDDETMLKDINRLIRFLNKKEVLL